MEFKIKEVEEVELSLLKKLVVLERKAFGEGGLNRWTMPVILRYGRVFTLNSRTDIIGLAQFLRDWQKGSLVFLLGFSVKPEYQGRGLGQKFLSGLLGILKKEGIKEIRLTVSPKNKKALKLYQGLGFKRKAFLPSEYGKGEDRLLLQLNLNST